jgi:hypothetical protein
MNLFRINAAAIGRLEDLAGDGIELIRLRAAGMNASDYQRLAREAVILARAGCGADDPWRARVELRKPEPPDCTCVLTS